MTERLMTVDHNIKYMYQTKSFHILSAVILMEGGKEEDLAILEEPEQEDGQRSRTTSENIDKT